MAMLRRYLTCLVLPGFLVLGVTGCSKVPGWLPGKYQMDEIATTKAMTETDRQRRFSGENKGDLLNFLGDLGKAFAPLLLTEAFKDMTITITDKEIRTTRNGDGSFVKYEVIEKPTDDAVTLKSSDGKIQTIKKTETGIAMKADGKLPITLYFKRIP